MNTSKKITLVCAISLLMPCTQAEEFSSEGNFFMAAFLCIVARGAYLARFQAAENNDTGIFVFFDLLLTGLTGFTASFLISGAKETVKEIITHYHQEKKSNSLKEEQKNRCY